MTTVSVAEAKDRLAALLTAAEAGETITITRHGKPVAELRAPSGKRKFDPKSIDWIHEQTKHLPKSPITGAEIVRQMRDED
jgi:antitoxin (DNA-binding transcriptional repressor) of toxin-antitoxin stability system